MEDFLKALQLRDWYAIAALGITLVVQLLRKQPSLRNKLWNKIPSGLRFLVPMLGGAAAAFVAAYLDGMVMTKALWAALGGAFAIGTGAMGIAASLKESPIPWDGRAGGKEKEKKTPTPPTAATILLSFLLTGCGLLGGGSNTPDKCSFENPTYITKFAECDQKIGECPKRDDGSPTEDCPALVECESWLAETCEQ